MQLTRHLSLPPAGTRRFARRPRRNPAAPSEPPTAEMVRARRTPPSQDRALYSCGCGYVFTARVTTTVDCPHCGTGQAW